jgi:glycosyltransferase involved in cell wall biosynthesis
MTLSVIIPAFNEEKRLPTCLHSVRRAIEACQATAWVEIIVCDNNSTDRTTEVAHAGGARVVFEPINQIGRARNAGASVATGEWLLFVDADSELDPRNLQRVIDLAQAGHHVGGGCAIWLEGAPWTAEIMCRGWNLFSRLAGWAAGSFIFCRAQAFRDIRGFSADFYAGEEINLSQRLKAYGPPYHVSSGRKFQLYTPWETLMLAARCVVMPWKALKSRRGLDYFYDGRR